MLNGSDAPRWLALVLLGLVTAGCEDALGPHQDDYSAARARWTRAGVDDYGFEFQRLCFCAPDFVRPVRIEILDGVVSSAVYVDTGEPTPPPLTSAPTIGSLFDEIRDALDRMAFSVTAEYDADAGYPITVSIDYLEHAIDDEMTFSVSSFRILDASGP